MCKVIKLVHVSCDLLHINNSTAFSNYTIEYTSTIEFCTGGREICIEIEESIEYSPAGEEFNALVSGLNMATWLLHL